MEKMAHKVSKVVDIALTALIVFLFQLEGQTQTPRRHFSRGSMLVAFKVCRLRPGAVVISITHRIKSSLFKITAEIKTELFCGDWTVFLHVFRFCYMLITRFVTVVSHPFFSCALMKVRQNAPRLESLLLKKFSRCWGGVPLSFFEARIPYGVRTALKAAGRMTRKSAMHRHCVKEARNPPGGINFGT